MAESMWDSKMVEDLAVSATFDLKEKITSRDGSKPVSIVRSVLEEYLPRDDDRMKRKFAKTIVDDPDLFNVWKSVPKGKKLLLAATGRLHVASARRTYEIEMLVPSQLGEFVVVNRGSVTKPLFYVASIEAYEGQGTKRKVVAKFGDKRLGSVPYSAFSESALGIVAFANTTRNTRKPPMETFDDINDQMVSKRNWIAEEAIERWMKGSKCVGAVRRLKQDMVRLGKDASYGEGDGLDDLLSEFRQEGIVADETKDDDMDDDWYESLSEQVKKNLRKELLSPAHREIVKKLQDFGTKITSIIARVPESAAASLTEIEDDFQVEFALNAIGIDARFALSSQDDKEWDVFRVGDDTSFDTDRNLYEVSLNDALSFVEENIV